MWVDQQRVLYENRFTRVGGATLKEWEPGWVKSPGLSPRAHVARSNDWDLGVCMLVAWHPVGTLELGVTKPRALEIILVNLHKSWKTRCVALCTIGSCAGLVA